MSVSKMTVANSSTPLILEFSWFLDYTKLAPNTGLCIYSSPALLQFFTRLASDPSSGGRKAFPDPSSQAALLPLFCVSLFFFIFFIEILQLSVLKKQNMFLCIHLLFEWMILAKKIKNHSVKIYPEDLHFQEDGVELLFQLQLKPLGIIHKTNI